MIRVIYRTIIIPRGDTGYFYVPNYSLNPNENDIAIFSVYDKMKRETVLEKIIPANEENIVVKFSENDTKHLSPKTYYWDLKLYKNPEYDEFNNIVGGEEIDSLYASYNLPEFIVKDFHIRENTLRKKTQEKLLQKDNDTVNI